MLKIECLLFYIWVGRNLGKLDEWGEGGFLV